jgi:Na+(H+)/acetate symporter ActP
LPRLSGKWQWKMLHPALLFSLFGATVNYKAPINCLVQGLLLTVYVCSCVNKLWAFKEPEVSFRVHRSSSLNLVLSHVSLILLK